MSRQNEYGFWHTITRSPYTPYSIYSRGTIWVLSLVEGLASGQVPNNGESNGKQDGKLHGNWDKIGVILGLYRGYVGLSRGNGKDMETTMVHEKNIGVYRE